MSYVSLYTQIYNSYVCVCVCSTMLSVHLPYKAVSSMRGLPKGPVGMLFYSLPPSPEPSQVSHKLVQRMTATDSG